VSPIFNKKHALVKNALAGITIPWYNAGAKNVETYIQGLVELEMSSSARYGYKLL